VPCHSVYVYVPTCRVRCLSFPFLSCIVCFACWFQCETLTAHTQTTSKHVFAWTAGLSFFPETFPSSKMDVPFCRVVIPHLTALFQTKQPLVPRFFNGDSSIVSTHNYQYWREEEKKEKKMENKCFQQSTTATLILPLIECHGFAFSIILLYVSPK
jgi:hypothetical protein